MLITELYGSVNASGFSSWDQPFYEATQDVLMSATDEIRDGVLNRLEYLGFWN